MKNKEQFYNNVFFLFIITFLVCENRHKVCSIFLIDILWRSLFGMLKSVSKRKKNYQKF